MGLLDGRAYAPTWTPPDWNALLDQGAQWGRGVQSNAASLIDPLEWKKAILALGARAEGARGAQDASLPVNEQALGDMMNFVSPMSGLLGMTKKVVGRGTAAPKQVDLPARFQEGEKAGIYRGSEAFGGITPQKLGAMRQAYEADALEGAPFSKYWYDNTSRDIYRIAGENTQRADQFADIAAITSSRTPVDHNTMYAFKGHNQNLVGDPIKTGGFPTVMGKAIDEALATGGSAAGLKRNPYAGGLSVEWRPNPDLRPVHDIHDVRAWGVTDPKTGELWDKGVGEAGHRFLDEQQKFIVNKLNSRARADGPPVPGPDAKAADWNSYRAQAAAWAPQRVRSEAARGRTMTIEDASKHYGNFFDEYSALIPRELEPGKRTGHQQEILNAPEPVRQQYANELEKPFVGPQGIDRLSSEMGLLTDRTLPNLGQYEGRATPGFTSRVGVGKTPYAQSMDPASERAVRSAASAHGLLGVQDQASYNYLGGNIPQKSAGGVTINRGSPVSPEELRTLAPQLEAAGYVAPMTDPRGLRALNFADVGAAERKPMAAAARDLAKQMGGEAQFRQNTGGLIPEEPAAAWSSKPFIEGIEGGGERMTAGFNRAVMGEQGIANRLLQTSQKLAQQHGLTSAPWYAPMMQGLKEGGLPRLKELVKQGIVPVFMLTLLGGAGGNLLEGRNQ